jgi:hypothetical protein
LQSLSLHCILLPGIPFPSLIFHCLTFPPLAFPSVCFPALPLSSLPLPSLDLRRPASPYLAMINRESSQFEIRLLFSGAWGARYI